MRPEAAARFSSEELIMLSGLGSLVRGGLRRRQFLWVGYSGLLGLTAGDVARRQAWAGPDQGSAKARNVIQVFLTGGPATIDMWDLKPDAPEKIRGEFRPIETSAQGVQISEHMPLLAKQMHLGTLIRSMTHTIAEHTQGQAYVMTGNRPRPAVESPSLGSLSAALMPTNRGIPINMTLGRVPAAGAGELGAVFNPFELTLVDERAPQASAEAIGLPEGFSTSDLDRRRLVLEKLDEKLNRSGEAGTAGQLKQFQQDALEILRSDRIRAALDVDREPDATRKPFGNSGVGRSALVARRLLEAGARFVTIGFGDWDTHDNNFTRLRTNMLPQLDQALGALLADLSANGLLKETIVYCAGEFGRTPSINTNAGRDHWSRAMTVLLAGGGIRPGIAWGATDDLGSDPSEHACSPDDVSATIFQQLGFGPAQQVQATSGRVSPLFRNGTVLHDLV
jgi:hypothetical protein